MGRWGIRGLETRVRWECSVSRGGAQIVQWRYTCRRSPRRESQWVGRGGAAPRVRAAKSSEFGEGGCLHFRWTHLEQAQHCTDLPRQVTFPAQTEQRKMGPGLG